MKRLMSPRTRATALLILWAIAACSAQGSLALRIELDRADVALGEPVAVQVWIRNDAAQPRPLVLRAEPEFGFVRYTITPPSGPAVRFTPWARKELGQPDTLAAREERGDLFGNITFGPRGFSFKQPGSYRVQAALPDGTVVERTLTVRPPGPGDAEAAASILASTDVGYFMLLGGGDQRVDAIQTLERIANGPDTSILKRYAQAALGRHWAFDFQNLRSGEVRKADWERAKPLLSASLAARAMSPYFHVQAALVLIRGARARNEPETANTAETQLRAFLSSDDRITDSRRKDLVTFLDRAVK